jgi:putative membrane protein
MQTLDRQDHDRIASAIRDAESKTAGEIYCVVARTSDSYFHAAAVSIALAIAAAGIVVGFALEWLWIDVRLPHFLLCQALALLAGLALLWWLPALRIHFVPLGLRYRRAHDNAMKQFLARNVHITAARTGVLIFVSLAEQYAEVIADTGIDAKVDQPAWNGIVADLVAHARADRLAEGFLGAIAAVGDLLATHVPPLDDDRNELDDHLVEI